MLYFIHGDPNMIFKKASKMADALLKKKPDASVFKLNSDNYDLAKVEELIGGQGLFVNKYIVIVSRLLEDNPDVLSHLKDIAESDNVFIWVEEKVNTKELNKIDKVAVKVQEYSLKDKKKEDINVFRIAELLGNRDKKGVWLEYISLIKQGIPVEEIYGILWWQIKSMLIASKTNSAKEAGMKDYPYNKARGYLNKWGDDLDGVAFDLVKLYHQSRVDGFDLSDNIERLLLKL